MIRLISVVFFLFVSILSEAVENRAQDIKAICDKFQITEKPQLEMYALAMLETSNKTMNLDSLVSETEEAINEKHVQENIFRIFSGFTDEELGTLRAIYENPVYQKVNYELFVSVGDVIQSKMRELLESHGEEKKQLVQPVREIIEVTEDNFCSEVLLSKQPIVIDFYTSRCVPCRFQARVLDALNQKYGNVVRIAKVNCDQQRRLAEYFEIRGVPSLLFFKPSEGLAVANRIVGLLPEEDLDKEFLKFQCSESEGRVSGACNLVDLSQVIPDIILDIRYATNNNFLGFPVYAKPVCYLHKKAADALIEVQKEFSKIGLCLKVFDGYRPLSVQQVMWDAVQDERYVSNPAKNKGRHTRGTAIDLTLVDREGNELEMPTSFDDFTEKAHSDYSDLSEEVLQNRTLLADVMERHGFQQLPTEWWHFDFQGWGDDSQFPPLDIPL